MSNSITSSYFNLSSHNETFDVICCSSLNRFLQNTKNFYVYGSTNEWYRNHHSNLPTRLFILIKTVFCPSPKKRQSFSKSYKLKVNLTSLFKVWQHMKSSIKFEYDNKKSCMLYIGRTGMPTIHLAIESFIYGQT